MRRSPLRFLWVFLALGCFMLSHAYKSKLADMRVDEKLSLAHDEREIASPELSFAISMGVFRSMLVDVLWLRAAKLQQEKRFFEIVQLYDMIGKLQPHNGMAWAYSAWNMAYNISVELPKASERWRWVKNGLDRLRFNGIPYNPSNRQLYWELGWIYFHKIGKNMDDAHLHYKTRLAENIQEIFGTENADAAKVYKAFLAGEPEAIAIANRMQREFGMDLKIMAETEVDERLGPLDWRMAEAHAIYWVRLGLIKGKYGKRPIDLERTMYQSLQHLLRQGTLVYFPKEGERPAGVVYWPDYRQAWPILRMFASQLEIFEKAGTSLVGVRSAFGYWMEEALEVLWLAGQNDGAEKLFRHVQQNHPGIIGGSSARQRISETLSKRLKEMNADQISALSASILVQHFWWKGKGDDKRSSALLRRAQEMWKLNKKFNPHGLRAVDRSFPRLKQSVLQAILQRGMFHPKIEARLRARLPDQMLSPVKPGDGVRKL